MTDENPIPSMPHHETRWEKIVMGSTWKMLTKEETKPILSDQFISVVSPSRPGLYHKVFVVRTPEHGYATDRHWLYLLLAEFEKEYMVVGMLSIYIEDESTWVIGSAQVANGWERKGLGTFLYRFAVNDAHSYGKSLLSIKPRSRDAEALWDSLYRKFPEKIEKTARGYKAKGPMRRRVHVGSHRRRR